MAFTQRREVTRRGGAERVTLVMVEVAVLGSPGAAGKHTPLVPGGDEVSKPGRRAIGRPTVIEQRPGQRIGEQPPPGPFGGEFPGQVGGNRTVTGEVSGLVVQSHQRGGGDGDLDLHTTLTAGGVVQ